MVAARGSTGVYWIPLYEILEQRGFEVVLVNARDVHNVRGRKSDVKDLNGSSNSTAWGSCVPASFRPAVAMVPLRSYLRQRAILVEELTARIQRMQKALTEMNLMLHTVVSDITGVTGLKIIHAILAGERDPERLAVHRDGRCHASHQELVAALTGNYREEHLFCLRQNFTAYQFHLQQIAECDAEIEALLNLLAAQQPPPAPTARVARG
jgi:transposase